jgi:hypothetical protein
MPTQIVFVVCWIMAGSFRRFGAMFSNVSLVRVD